MVGFELFEIIEIKFINNESILVCLIKDDNFYYCFILVEFNYFIVFYV